MIQFFVLLIFTLIVGTVLYFYPPNIPLKLKMTLLGLAFLLALGGLFVLDKLSYGLALAAIMAIAFVASYVAEKGMNLVPAAAGQTEIVLSFTEEESLREKESEVSDAKAEVLDVESAVTVEKLPTIEEIANQEVVLISINEESLSETEAFESLDVIDLLDMELEDIVERNVEIEMAEPVQELDLSNKLAELTDDEFAFLTETREISEENVTELTAATDIEDVDIFLQRSAILEEMLEELPQEHEIDSLEEEVHTIDEEISVTETEDLLVTEEIHLKEEPIILEEILIENPEHVEPTPDEIVTNDEEIEIANGIAEVAEIDAVEVLEEEVEVQAADEFIADEERAAEEFPTPDMNADVQDMLLNTLFSYQEQGDNASYQVMIETILNQSLSDKDYYLFGKLLLDSYASSNEISKMRDLLEHMETRLQSYFVIAEELQRYKEMFLVKN